MMRKKDNRGFTLIELLVVIAIIGLLAAIIIASLSSARKKGRDARRAADIKQIQTALELYQSDNGNYPKSTAANTAYCITDTTNGLANKGLTSSYIGTIPDDPTVVAGGSCTGSANSHYYWAGDTAGSFYCLGAKLEGTTVASQTYCSVAAAKTNIDAGTGAAGSGIYDTGS